MRLTRRELLRAGGGALAAGALGGAGLLGCSPRRDALESGAYLRRATATTAEVGALGRGAERFVLRWGALGGPLDRTVEEPAPTAIHRLVATDLAPGARYAYRLERADGSPVGSGTFRAAPAPGEPFTFAAVGDTGGTETSRGKLVDELDEEHEALRGQAGDENQQARVAAAMLARSADLVLHTGDVVYPDGALGLYPEAFFRPFGALAAHRPILPAPGNHDVKAAGGRAFLDLFCAPGDGPLPDGRARSLDWGDLHVALLDVVASDFARGGPQLAWLEETLRASERRWKAVVLHVPPVRATKPGDYDAVMADVVPALRRAGADLLLAGHDHVYARYFPMGGLTCVTTGGGGKDLYAVRADERLAYGESVFHFVEVDVTPRRLTLRAVDATGRVFDGTTIDKG